MGGCQSAPGDGNSDVHDHDVLIIGGGITGLVTLKELQAQNLNAFLATEGLVGDGQTIRCHGWLHVGTMPAIMGHTPVSQSWKTASEKLMNMPLDSSLPASGENLLQLGKDGGDGVYAIVAKGMYEETSKKALEECGFKCEEQETSEDGVVRIHSADRIFCKGDWVSRLAKAVGHNCIGCNLKATSLTQGTDNRWTVTFTDGSSRTAGAVVIAAGPGIGGLLEKVKDVDLAGETQEDIIKRHHQVRPLHMFCVKGPRSILGTSSSLALRPNLPPALIVANSDDPKETILYCTPFPGAPKPELPKHAQWVNDTNVASNADALSTGGQFKPEPDFAMATFKALFADRPEIAEDIRKNNNQMQFGIYVGVKQDAGWATKPMQPHVQPYSESCQSLIVANCQFVHLSKVAAEAVSLQVQKLDLTKVEKPQTARKSACQVAKPVENRMASKEFEWMSFHDFAKKHGFDGLSGLV